MLLERQIDVRNVPGIGPEEVGHRSYKRCLGASLKHQIAMRGSPLRKNLLIFSQPMLLLAV